MSPCVSPIFICCSGDLAHLLQGGCGWISGSEVVLCSHPFQYVLIQCRPEGICPYAICPSLLSLT